MDFKITAPFEPDGDQPQAIEKLAEGIEKDCGHRSCSGLPELGKPILLRRLLIK